jgi:glyoxylase-like metal-dependent hydrolase (beta-lactamase superfamily II)
MDPLWGQILPAPAEKVTAVHDRDVINVCGLSFTAIETPGHARHHHVYQLGDIAFVGDAAGIKLPGCDLIDLPAPPPEFDLDVWTQTVDLLIAKSFTTIYPTHYGPVENVEDHLISVKNLLMEAAVLVRDKMADGVDRDELVAQYTAWSRGRARMLGLADKVINQYETVNPLYMSVDGIMRYWRKRSEM